MTGDADLVFLETTRALAPARLAAEDVRVALRLLGGAAPVADLGCGYGRHLAALRAQGVLAVGVDRSPLLLAEARKVAPVIRADLRGLPLRSLPAAVCFYSSMFLGTEGDARAALAEAARALRPGGGLLLTTDNPLRLAARSEATFDVPGVGRVAERSAFDGAVDAIVRTLERPGRATLTAEFRIRYYLPPALEALARSAGFASARIEPLTLESPQLVALLRR